jgi:hypothetical protein
VIADRSRRKRLVIATDLVRRGTRRSRSSRRRSVEHSSESRVRCRVPLGPVVAGLLLDFFSARATVAAFCIALLVFAVLASTDRAIRNAPSLSELEPA